MLNEIQKADDPEKLWPKAELLTAIGFPAKTKNFLCNLYWENEDSVSLNTVFELAVSEQKDRRSGYIISTLIFLRNVGPKTFLEIVRSLHHCNMGKQCNAVWNQRYQRFLAAKRIAIESGVRFSVARPTC